MPVEYPHLIIFPGGALVDSADPRETVIRSVKEGKAQIQELGPGEYDVTPEHWRRETRVKYRYNLIVNEDGTSVLRLIPKYADSATIEVKPNDEDIIRRGGRIVNLPAEAVIVPIAGPKNGNPNDGVYIFSAIISGATSSVQEV